MSNNASSFMPALPASESPPNDTHWPREILTVCAPAHATVGTRQRFPVASVAVVVLEARASQRKATARPKTRSASCSGARCA
jgi:hypothetical protein